MTFQEYCDSLDDEQTVSSGMALVLSFENSKNEVFSVSPFDVKSFLEAFVSNHKQVVSAWQAIPSKKGGITEYEEKSYRAIYKSLVEAEIGSVLSLGKSQTKGITQLLSKLIAYLSDESFDSVEKSTLFEPALVKKALTRFDSLNDLGQDGNITTCNDRRRRFISWLTHTAINERTGNHYTLKSAKSYANTSIGKAQKILSQSDTEFVDLYRCSLEKVKDAVGILAGDKEWKEADKKGGQMYTAGMKVYLRFLESTNRCNPLGKPFVLLAGISGTGKTRFVRNQAEYTDADRGNYSLVPVRPDWHEPSDLLGYISRLGGSDRFVVTDVLRFMLRAWRVLSDNGVKLENGCATGPVTLLEQIPPFWLCLDEMNLAPVEQYFADFLAVLETRHWHYEGEQFSYSCDPIVPASMINQFDTPEKSEQLRGDLGIADDMLWQQFCEHGIGLPFNLIVAGTVNMDETTHGFSRKVIDRAITLDFGEFYPNKFSEFFEPKTSNIMFTYSRTSDGSSFGSDAPAIDPRGERSVEFLEAVNSALSGTPFELAYRALNELLLAVMATRPADEETLQAVWDDFVMTKVLPRIEGDAEKLAVVGSADESDDVLSALTAVLENEFSSIWPADQDQEGGKRPDLHREQIQTSSDKETTVPLTIECRSHAKIKWMRTRLDRVTFTSFWP